MNSLKTISGEVTILGDKSISHRCIILGSLAEGESQFKNILISGDTTATIEIFRSLGVKIDLINGNTINIHGVGLKGLKEPTNDLDLETLELLEQRLVDFQGTVLVVSHDREFVSSLSTKVIELKDDGAHYYSGNYEDYLLTQV